MARIAADGMSLAATAFAVSATRSSTIDALVNAVTGGQVNNQSLSTHLLSGIMRFVSDHVPTLAQLDADEGRMLQNAILITTSDDAADVALGVQGLIADAVTDPSDKALGAAYATVDAALGDLPVAAQIKGQLSDKVTAFRTDLTSRFLSHMETGENQFAAQKMMKAIVDSHTWTPLDKLFAKLVDKGTDGNSLLRKAANVGYGIIRHALDTSVVADPKYAVSDDSALHAGGTLFSTVAALAKIEGFTADGASGLASLAARSLTHISPALQADLNAISALTTPALDGVRRTRALITAFSDSVANIERTFNETPKLKMKLAASAGAMAQSWEVLQKLVASMQETTSASAALLDQSLLALKGLQDSDAAAAIVGANGPMMDAAQTISDLREKRTADVMRDAIGSLKHASWYPQLIAEMDVRTPGSGSSLDGMLNTASTVIDASERAMQHATGFIDGVGAVGQGLGAIATGLNPFTMLYGSPATPSDAPVAEDRLAAAAEDGERGVAEMQQADAPLGVFGGAWQVLTGVAQIAGSAMGGVGAIATVARAGVGYYMGPGEPAPAQDAT